jgi:hypothetical protein
MNSKLSNSQKQNLKRLTKLKKYKRLYKKRLLKNKIKLNDYLLIYFCFKLFNKFIGNNKNESLKELIFCLWTTRLCKS